MPSPLHGTNSAKRVGSEARFQRLTVSSLGDSPNHYEEIPRELVMCYHPAQGNAKVHHSSPSSFSHFSSTAVCTRHHLLVRAQVPSLLTSHISYRQELVVQKESGPWENGLQHET